MIRHGRVGTGDIGNIQGHLGEGTDSSNFRDDINVDGHINNQDVQAARLHRRDESAQSRTDYDRGISSRLTFRFQAGRNVDNFPAQIADDPDGPWTDHPLSSSRRGGDNRPDTVKNLLGAGAGECRRRLERLVAADLQDGHQGAALDR
ncbi:MAG: hypothetical protein ABIU29_02640 [Chthoniobacterales bacterium]